jgi:pyridoxal phosphate enzyme (YggS family)
VTQAATEVDDPARRAELAANLARLRARVAAAAAAAGRDPGGITLIAVTKTYPATDVVRLAELGVREIGENRDQEAAAKAAEVAAAEVAVRWHFVGRLQRNKCRSVVGYADLVHSVDSVRLAAALAAAAAAHRDRPLDVLVQVRLDADPGRGGASPEPGAEPDRALPRVAAAVAGGVALRLRGLMAVAPLAEPAEAAFARLAGIAQRLRADHPEAVILSAGMSGDLEAAVAHGATHLRIGAAVLGKRAPLR